MSFIRFGLRPRQLVLLLAAMASLGALLAAPLQAQPGFPAVVLQDALSGFSQPVFVGHAGDGSKRLFVVEQSGRVRIVKNGQLLVTPFIDISARVLTGSERGLLGLAFAPDYTTSGYFYLYYTSSLDDGDGPGDITVSRFSRSSNADQADAGSEVQLLTIEHTARGNHNGGMLAFGPRDGYLYIATGDGGGSNDPDKNARNPLSLLGKLLRIDVTPRPASPTVLRRFLPLAQAVPRAGRQAGASDEPPEYSAQQLFAAQLPYSIPPGNPFANRAGYRPEIWAVGLRNPWRFSFDRQTGDLYIGDVGQGAWEEVDWEVAGGAGGVNYGWPQVEGPDCNAAISATCDKTGLAAPVSWYGRTEGESITGGYVYRGARSPALAGVYIFGDFSSGRVWGLRRDNGVWRRGPLLDSTANIASFGEDETGEVYLVDYSGTIYRVATN